MQNFVFFLTGVTRNMNFFETFVNDVGTLFIKVIDDAIYHFLVSRDRRGGNDDRIVIADRHFIEISRSHAGKRAHRLALRARGNDDELAVE